MLSVVIDNSNPQMFPHDKLINLQLNNNGVEMIEENNLIEIDFKIKTANTLENYT